MGSKKRKFPAALHSCQCQKKQARPLSSPLLALIEENQKVSFLITVSAKELEEVMACESQERYKTDPISSTPAPLEPPHSAPPSSLRNPKEYDQCFICKRFGHWAKDCLNKTLKKSQASSPGSPSSPSWNASDLPMVRCPCGRGTCKVCTSHTDKNPGRKFFTCPVDRRSSGNCKFFKWSDEIVARYKPPMCPCGAGKCSLNMESSGPDKDRWYFACRVKKNHGACQFFQWADSEVKNMLNMHLDESKGYSARRSLFTDHQVLTLSNELCKEDDQSSDIEMESAMVESFENSPHSSMTSPCRKDEIHVEDLVMQEAESWDLGVGTALHVPSLTPKSQFRCRESECSLQISAAEHTTSEGTFPSFDPVIENVGDIEDLTLLADSSSNDDENIPHGPLLRFPGEDAEHCNSVFQEPSGIKILVQENDISRSPWKTFGQGLLDILQSMDQTQHETMLKVAEATFDTLHHLSIDYESFSKAVREYIHCKSKLAGIEESMGKDFCSEEFLGHYNDKKTQFDSVSQLHVEAINAFEDSENRLQLLRGEVSRVKDVLLQLEKQLSFCEAEALECKTRVAEISKYKSESESSLDAACEKMEEAFKLEHERESMVDAAKAALENARVQIQQ